MLFGRPRHHERERVLRGAGGKASQRLFPAFIGEQELPAQPMAITSIEDRWRWRGDLEPIAVALDKGPTAHVPLDQPFRFQLSIGVRHRGPVHAQHNRKLAAGRDAVARPQVAGMHQGAKLVAQLDIQGNMALRLKVDRKHWFLPQGQLYMELACYKSQYVFSRGSTSIRSRQADASPSSRLPPAHEGTAFLNPSHRIGTAT